LLLASSGTYTLQATPLSGSVFYYSNIVSTWDVAITYHADGIVIQESYYPDAAVFTDLNLGCQIVEISNITFRTNCEYSVVGDYIVHQYVWGEVWTLTGYQEIRFY
jgi:hypothetical protein